MSRWRRIATFGAMTGRAATQRVGVALRHALSPEQRQRAQETWEIATAKEVAQTLSRLKGAALKAGQQVAVAAAHLDLPQEVQDAFARLQHSATPVPYDTIRAVLERELQGSIEDFFAHVEPTPLGTASLGQAHAATLPDGKQVVVKVLHEGVAEALETDLLMIRTMMNAGRLVGRSASEIDDVYSELATHLRAELDYLQEAANIHAFRESLGCLDGVHVPGTHPALCTERVLTMDRIHGVTLDEFVETASDAAKQRAGMILAKLLLEGTFKHRLLHADPHAGNFLFTPDGEVGVIDLGCVKRFNPFFLGNYARAVLAALERDRAGLLEACEALGVWGGETPAAGEAIWQFCDAALTPWRVGESVIGEEEDLVKRCAPAAAELWRYPEIRGAQDMVFLHRTLAGTYEMARRLRVRGAWGDILRHHLEFAIREALV